MEKEKPNFTFSAEKNQQLINDRGISFEEVIAAIENNAILDIVPHYNLDKYANQEIYVLNINNYVYLVPFIRESKNSIFLKTIFPHRKLTRLYLGGQKNDEEKS